MLQIVIERFVRCAERHLNEAQAWNAIAKDRSEQNDLFGLQYANRKAGWHLDMAKFWGMAIKDIHYIPGTWAYKF